MDLSTTSQTSAVRTNPTGRAPEQQAISSDFQMFLKMLTAQMKNQDPLNPIESSDYAVQLATFSGVEQQVKTNDLLASLTAQLGVTAMGQYASWVGMEARSSAPAPFAGQPLTVYPTPAKGADKTVLVAYDDKNREVWRQEIPVSSNPVQWIGTTASGGQVLPGNYTFKLENYSGGQLTSTDKVQTFNRVTEVRQSATGPLLVLTGGATVAPGDVSALRPGATP
ncbi:flagellar hook assembly protein FlgD [Frigidibacter sp. RF13]|uniref:flagellar hook capping FlgD N-terminal domain-containing protein n=1 Tax=Frigidibacter sp. RF13 TaxID=2997340 RepID=UPI002270CA37|nr:flagellar hook capping FlgD N-terminal domain-containing protein [Frigidibacter sp. RF13]MCY1128713.1 flagellar hook assembly protein FlgD [Frigidibacter sp. RF13]